MDRVNRSSKTAGNDFSELTSDGLILWHLSFAGQSDLWCLIFELPDGFYLAVDDDPVGTESLALAEQHVDIVSVLNRSEALKGSLLRCGWMDVEID